MNEFLPEFVVDETVDIAAPVGRVWEAIVDTPARAAWWPYLNLDATVGGRFEERCTNDEGVEVVTEGQVVDFV